MSPYLILLIILLYFGVLFAISYLAGRKADNQGFFVGNRKSNWHIVAFGMIGAAISGVTFVSVPGTVAASSFSYMQMVLGFAVGQAIIAFVLIPLYYKMNLTSIYQYLNNRFGLFSYKTGAWIFFISKMLGASIRLFIVCLSLQLLVFDPLSLPFVVNVIFTVGLVWLYTFKGGVKSLIWTDSFKTLCLIVSVGLSIYYIADNLNLSFSGMLATIGESPMSKTFFFDDANDARFFFKQFFAGVFMVIATTGLDQDMMQKTLSVKDYRGAQKNMLTSGVLQIFIVLLFLMLGVLLYTFAAQNNVALPDRSDKLFPMLAMGGYFPIVVGVLFIIGLISASYAAAGSALTALTTSFTVDILQSPKNKSDEKVASIRKKVHVGMALVMGLVIIAIELLSSGESVLSIVYRVAAYTYGPILGLFAFGILTKRIVTDKYIPIAAIAAPILCFIIDRNSKQWLSGYEFSYELLIMNALFTFIGLFILSKKNLKN